MQDPLGKKLVATEQPLAEADKLAQMLKTHAPQDMRSHVASFDVAERLDKPHLALKAAKQAVALNEASADSHQLRVRALLWLEKRLPQIEIKVAREGMEADLQKLTGTAPCSASNNPRIARCCTCFKEPLDVHVVRLLHGILLLVLVALVCRLTAAALLAP